MVGFLRRVFGHQQASQPTDEDIDLEQFYTNAEHARQIFEQLVSATNLTKRLLVIHGIGGVGKSTLLKMYALFCHKHRISVALVASEEASSPVDVLADWAGDLDHDGVVLPAFQKTLTRYRALQVKVEDESRKGHQAKSEIAGRMGKAAAKTAINMAASAIPIVGPLVGTVGGESAEAFIDWLHEFLTKPDMDLYLDPTKRLSDDFLSDLARVAAPHHRIVLMTDTYERMTALDDWMRELARRLPKNVLLVLAGRAVPAWERAWPGWMGRTETLELKEMASNDIRTLVHRYYGHIRSGDPDPQQVEAIVQFARGLPMVATTVVQLWVKYGLEEFQTVRPQVVADLVDRLLEGVPQEMRPAFEAAAVLRYFNVEILNALLESGNAETLYAELRRWPFIRSRKEGLAVHDTMREMINEGLHIRTPEHFQMLHERATRYYEVQLQKATSDEREKFASERLYHRVCSDENSGVQLFQEQAEELTRYRLVDRLRALLNDANNYSLERESNHLWREYYNARLAHLETRFTDAEKVYQTIGENERVEPKLRAYALSDWGGLLRRRERLRQPGMEEKAIQVLESSLHIGVETDAKLARSWLYLSDIYMAKANWEKSLSYLDQARRFIIEHNDNLSLLTLLSYERGIYGRQGNLRKTLDIEKEMWDTYMREGEPAYLRILIAPTWEWIWVGHYAEREKELRAVVDITRSLQDLEYLVRRVGNLVLCLSLQGKCSEAHTMEEEILSLVNRFGSGGELEVSATLTSLGIACFKCGKFDSAEKYLTESIAAGQRLHAHLDIAPVYLASLYEVRKQFDKAKYYYQFYQSEAHSLDRHYHDCGTLTGLVRVNYAQNDNSAILPLWVEAERLAQKYEYNDYLTSLYLTKGHITWDGLIPEWESGLDSALYHYRLALIHALRFNRFLLDEALSGRELGTPLWPIIPHCLERGKEGRRMLTALRDWWQNGTNDIGTPRSDSISPLPEGVSLWKAERIARQREPGDGSPQKTVVEQIHAVLQ